MDLTAYQVKKMKEQKDKYYLLVDEPECTNVCYWYVPERLRPRNFPQAYTRDWHIELGKVSSLLIDLVWNNVKIRLEYLSKLPINVFLNRSQQLWKDEWWQLERLWSVINLLENIPTSFEASFPIRPFKNLMLILFWMRWTDWGTIFKIMVNEFPYLDIQARLFL